MLLDKILDRQSNIVLYGITPPKKNTAPEKIAEIAKTQISRIKDLPIDGLILYDIFDETSRTPVERPFPFIETVDAFDYAEQHLSQLEIPKVIYRACGKYSSEQLNTYLNKLDHHKHMSVFVGAASKGQPISLSLNDAYALKQNHQTPSLLGGVTIAERHLIKGDEHLRVFDKIARGCQFFVSQGVYDVNASKSFLSDYYYYARSRGLKLVPIIFTLTPCGSVKTLDFMKWLGISIPRWLENDLIHSQDILEKSVRISEENYKELKAFANEKNIPIGCNIESVATRKVEVEASIALLKQITG